MYSLMLLAAASFLTALLLTPVIRNLFRRLGVVDTPGDERRVHTEPIPRVGGIAVFVSYVGAVGILLLAGLSAGGMVRGGMPLIERLLPAVCVMFATGLLDDLVGLKPWQKFTGQLAAAGLAMWGGVLVEGFVGYSFSPWLAYPLTLLWLVGCANAFNLIDGVDGLAAGVGLFATMTMLLAALIHGNVPLAMATVPLAGALLGFLRYNFNPATIFLGDSGSLTIGFLLGCFGALWSQKAATILGMTAPLMALSIPLLDTTLAMARRFLRRQRIWDADRGHIHHRLLDRGLTPRKTALLLYAAAGIGAILSIAQSAGPKSFGGIVLVLFCLVTWMGIQHLGYVEFGTVGRLLIDGAFRRHLNWQIELDSFEKRLEAAKTPVEFWNALESSARKFGYNRVQVCLASVNYESGETNGNSLRSWTVRIPISATEYVNLERHAGSAEPLARVGPFADVIQRILQQKLQKPLAAAAAAGAAQAAAAAQPAPAHSELPATSH